jgi:hypothetical protein
MWTVEWRRSQKDQERRLDNIRLARLCHPGTGEIMFNVRRLLSFLLL